MVNVLRKAWNAIKRTIQVAELNFNVPKKESPNIEVKDPNLGRPT